MQRWMRRWPFFDNLWRRSHLVLLPMLHLHPELQLLPPKTSPSSPSNRPRKWCLLRTIQHHHPQRVLAWTVCAGCASASRVGSCWSQNLSTWSGKMGGKIEKPWLMSWNVLDGQRTQIPSTWTMFLFKMFNNKIGWSLRFTTCVVSIFTPGLVHQPGHENSFQDQQAQQIEETRMV